MPLTSHNNAMRPPGGSNFGGAFTKDAFAAYVFPKPGERRYERKEHLASTHGDPMAMSTASVSFHMVREAQQPSRLRRAFDNQVKMRGPDRREGVMEASLRRTQSNPNMRQQADEPASPPSPASSSFSSPGGIRGSFSAADLRRSESVQEDHPDSATWKLADQSMNTRWNPHPSTLRGQMKMTAAAASIYGIDPLKDVSHDCPFYEADKHRFAKIKQQPEARLATPTRSMRWKSEDHWADEANHPALKVTHVSHAGPRRTAAQKAQMMRLLDED